MIATLASVVAMLFKADQAKDAKRIESLERSCEMLTTEAKECRQDREELRVKIARVEERLAVLDHREK